MTPAMTIFCHGTSAYSDERDPGGSASEAEDELVEILEKHFVIPRGLQGSTFNGGKLLLHGVGSLHDPTSNKVARSGDGFANAEGRNRLPRLLNQAIGNGVGANVDTAITLLDAMVEDGLRPGCVNMVGWSRGGVTCVRLAQAMRQQPSLRDIRVNIFAGDPVPGWGRHSNFLSRSKTYDIPANVDRYFQIYALDLADFFHGVGFKGLRPKRESETTRIGWLPMPGDHGGVVKAGSGAPGELTMDLAIRFLQLCGSIGFQSELLARRTLSFHEIHELYGRIMTAINARDGSYPSAELYAESGRGGYRIGQMPSGRGSEFATTFRRQGFVNQHHKFVVERLLAADGASMPSELLTDDPETRGLIAQVYDA